MVSPKHYVQNRILENRRNCPQQQPAISSTSLEHYAMAASIRKQMQPD
jgi:hypothetical protein